MSERALTVVEPREEASLSPAKPRQFALSPKSLPELLQLGGMLVKSGLMPEAVRTPEAAAAIVLKGSELGLPPMASIENISIIKGKPTCSAHLMLALVKRDYGPGAIRVAESDHTACTVEWKEQGWTGVRSHTFTIEDAQRAGLLASDTWKKYPAAMLRARCISAVVKMAFPESVGGLYIPDELGADVTVSDGEVVVVSAKPYQAPAPPSQRALEPKRGVVKVEDGHTGDTIEVVQPGWAERAAVDTATGETVYDVVNPTTGEIIEAEFEEPPFPEDLIPPADFTVGRNADVPEEPPIEVRVNGQNVALEPLATERQMKFIHAIANEVGKTHDDLHDLAMQTYGTGMKDLTRRNASNFIDRLRAAQR